MRKYFVFFLTIVLLLTNCNLKRIRPVRRPSENSDSKRSYEEQSRLVEMYWTVRVLDVEKVKRLLDEGYDPGKCTGEEGWESGTPLNVVTRSHYTTYGRRLRGEEITDPPPDVAVLQLLVAAGADINKRPYVWCRVTEYDNFSIEGILNQTTRVMYGDTVVTKAEAEAEAISCVDDVNRVLEALLEAGADPDKLGHIYPYSYEGMMNGMSDEEANSYFANGTRAINEAIKKGMWWESQVDLLLRYTTLDEASLEAAQESNDPAMIGKINRLWIKQWQRG
jgi:hypothetical protein